MERKWVGINGANCETKLVSCRVCVAGRQACGSADGALRF